MIATILTFIGWGAAVVWLSVYGHLQHCKSKVIWRECGGHVPDEGVQQHVASAPTPELDQETRFIALAGANRAWRCAGGTWEYYRDELSKQGYG